jgi:xanthine dehydrogenase accessory factor
MNTPQEFAPLLAGLRRLQASGFAGGGALATLTRTSGSTFRRAGARMLICGDGHIVRGLSGGCPERDIITRAQGVIAAGRAEIVRYNRDYGLDAMVEMGCGGELEVLIEPLAAHEDLLFVDAVANCLDARREGFLATAFMQDGGCLPRPLRLVWSGNIACSNLGDSVLTDAVVAQGHAAGNAPILQGIDTASGRYEVLIERLRPPHALLLVGVTAGAVALARFAQTLGWDVTLVDHDEQSPPPAELPTTVRLLRAGPDRLLSQLRADRHSSAVVMTHNLERDAAYLRALATLPLAYLGAIGSRSRSAKLGAATGLAPPRLRAPAGLDLGSETPEEIALAIAAEILAVTSGRSGGVLSAHDGPIH